MKKLFNLFLLIGFSLILVGCIGTKKNQDNHNFAKIIEDLSVTKSIIVNNLLNNCGDISNCGNKTISDMNEIKELISMISEAKPHTESDILITVGASFKIEMLDAENNLIYDVLIYIYAQNDDLGVSFEIGDHHYSVQSQDKERFLEIIGFNN